MKEVMNEEEYEKSVADPSAVYYMFNVLSKDFYLFH